MHVKFAKQFTHYLILFRELESNKKSMSSEEGYSETSDKGHSEKRTNLPTKDKPKIILYTHSIENHL